MRRIVQLKNGTTLHLEQNAFASGGEGELFKIVEPVSFQKQVVKIYKPEKRTEDRKSKIEYLVAHPPTSIKNNDGHYSVIWAEQVIYENGKFVGYLMPLAKGEKLEKLCHPKLPPSLNSDWHRFEFGNSQSTELRLKLCFNIAAALFQIHTTKHYVLVDMKPDNIMVQPNGLISVIDVDSTAIVHENKVLYNAPVVTAEYAPPEYYRDQKLNKEFVTENWDKFSIAIIFYRLLCGIHPYIGTCIAPYEKCDGIGEMIENGLFANGSKSSLFKIIPPPHSRFNNINSSLKELFKRAFDDGQMRPDIRPSADEWCRNLFPQQLYQINRPFPSALLTFPSYPFSKGIGYRPKIVVSFPAIGYMNPPALNPIRAIIAGIVGKTDQQKSAEAIRNAETQLKLKENSRLQFEDDLKAILNSYTEKEALILEQEKQRVSSFKNEFSSELSKLDKEAVELQTMESNEMKNFHVQLSNTLSDIDVKIKKLHIEIFGDEFHIHESQKAIIYKQVESIESKQKAEINGLIQNPSKLSKYRIENASLQKFGQATIQSLNVIGIFTAADFVDISAEGYLKNRLGQWVKANNVGWNKAYLLEEWRKRCDLKENQIILDTTIRKYEREIASLNQAINDLESKFRLSIKPRQLRYDQEKARMTDDKTKHTEEYQKKADEIKLKYDQLNAVLLTRGNAIKESVNFKFGTLMEDIGNQLNANVKSHTVAYTSKKQEIDSFINDMNDEIEHLSGLQSELKKMQQVN
ncbi:MAG: hypothetical protein J0H74_36375 [Chitinophagaceae bacterium]|nr:hypothetical protein [Chitinophagaceae bacterium]